MHQNTDNAYGLFVIRNNFLCKECRAPSDYIVNDMCQSCQDISEEKKFSDSADTTNNSSNDIKVKTDFDLGM